MVNAFEEKVRRHIRKLDGADLAELGEQTSRKRRDWFVTHKPAVPERPVPRDAFDLLFFDYMGLVRDDLEVIAENDSEIIWLSKNKCPTLEACNHLGMDTRIVCKVGYEKSTQAFVSVLDPALRFIRSYEEIRPYAAHCREMIVRVDFERMMSLAIDEATCSRKSGNLGDGAVIAIGNEVVAKACDTVVADRDSAKHADAKAIQQASSVLGRQDLSPAILFTTCEPCESCAALCTQSNLSAVVYGVSAHDIGKPGVAGTTRAVAGESNMSRAGIEVIVGVCHEDCLAHYQ